MILSFQRLRRDGLALLLIGLLFWVGIGARVAKAHGQGVLASAGGASDIHIGVVERREPVQLSARNVTAMVAGKSYGVAISQNVTTHLLTILQQGPENIAPYNEALERLRLVFGRGWLVSVVRPDGYATPYVGNQAALRGALNSGVQTSYNYETLLQKLAGFAGRRVLIVEQSVSATNVPMLAEARALIPEVYRVDGGLLARPEDSAVDGGFNLPAPSNFAADLADDVPATPAASIPPPARIKGRTANGVMHEVKLAAAVKDALSGAAHYYDLDLRVPASGSDMPLELTYYHLPRSTVVFSERPYLVAASANDSPKREPLRDSFRVEILRPSR